MTTLNQLASAHATALSLHATLSQFALETLDPTIKTMYIEMASGMQVIASGIERRKQQLTTREQFIAQQYAQALEAHAIVQSAEMTETE